MCLAKRDGKASTLTVCTTHIGLFDCVGQFVAMYIMLCVHSWELNISGFALDVLVSLRSLIKTVQARYIPASSTSHPLA